MRCGAAQRGAARCGPVRCWAVRALRATHAARAAHAVLAACRSCGRRRGRRHGHGCGRAERRCAASQHASPSRIALSPRVTGPRRAAPRSAALRRTLPRPCRASRSMSGRPRARPGHARQRRTTPRPIAAPCRGRKWHQAAPHAVPAGAPSGRWAHEHAAASSCANHSLPGPDRSRKTLGGETHSSLPLRPALASSGHAA